MCVDREVNRKRHYKNSNKLIVMAAASYLHISTQTILYIIWTKYKLM